VADGGEGLAALGELAGVDLAAGEDERVVVRALGFGDEAVGLGTALFEFLLGPVSSIFSNPSVARMATCFPSSFLFMAPPRIAWCRIAAADTR
jgi:hypothetical protein